MVPPNGGMNHSTKCGNNANEFGALYRMGAEKCLLFRRESIWFPEQRSELFVDLADVVQQRGCVDLVNERIRELALLGNHL